MAYDLGLLFCLCLIKWTVDDRITQGEIDISKLLFPSSFLLAGCAYPYVDIKSS